MAQNYVPKYAPKMDGLDGDMLFKNQEKKMGPLVPHCWPRPCAASVLLLEPGVLMLGQPDVLCAK